MANLFSLPTLIGLGAAIVLTGVITLGLRAMGLPREVSLYFAVCAIAGSGTLLYGRLARRR